MASFIKNKYPDYTYYFYPPYISIALNIDLFNHDKRKDIPEIYTKKEIPKNSLIIWDNWCAVVEYGIPLEKLQQDKRLKEIKEFNVPNVRFVVFESVNGL
jgi:hypothetical protein